MKVTSYRPYSPRRTAAVEKGSFAAAFLTEEHAAAEPRLNGSGGNMDQLQISNTFPRSEIEKTAAQQAQALTQPADAGRLESLRSAVQSGSYHIPTDKLVDAMMGWRIL